MIKFLLMGIIFFILIEIIASVLKCRILVEEAVILSLYIKAFWHSGAYAILLLCLFSWLKVSPCKYIQFIYFWKYYSKLKSQKIQFQKCKTSQGKKKGFKTQESTISTKIIVQYSQNLWLIKFLYQNVCIYVSVHAYIHAFMQMKGKHNVGNWFALSAMWGLRIRRNSSGFKASA